MPTTEKLIIEIKAQNKDLITKVNEVQGKLGQVEGKTADIGKNTAVSLAKMAGGWMAVKTAVKFAINTIKESINLAIVQREAESRLEQVLRSTGEAAGYNKKQLLDMASAMQKVTKYGDEEIIGAQSLLLTFTKIGKKTFPNALEAVLNLSTAMGTDLKSSAVQIGKALNDPIRGIASLTESGVQFSEEQQKVIKALTETGRVAEAQKVILKELEVQFGGQAKALATADGGFKQLSNTIGDQKERLGNLVIDGVKPLVKELNNLLSPQNSLDITTNNLITAYKEYDEIVKILAKDINNLSEEENRSLEVRKEVLKLEITKGIEELNKTYEKYFKTTEEGEISEIERLDVLRIKQKSIVDDILAAIKIREETGAKTWSEFLNVKVTPEMKAEEEFFPIEEAIKLEEERRDQLWASLRLYELMDIDAELLNNKSEEANKTAEEWNNINKKNEEGIKNLINFLIEHEEHSDLLLLLNEDLRKEIEKRLQDQLLLNEALKEEEEIKKDIDTTKEPMAEDPALAAEREAAAAKLKAEAELNAQKVINMYNLLAEEEKKRVELIDKESKERHDAKIKELLEASEKLEKEIADRRKAYKELAKQNVMSFVDILKGSDAKAGAQEFGNKIAGALQQMGGWAALIGTLIQMFWGKTSAAVKGFVMNLMSEINKNTLLLIETLIKMLFDPKFIFNILKSVFKMLFFDIPKLLIETIASMFTPEFWKNLFKESDAAEMNVKVIVTYDFEKYLRAAQESSDFDKIINRAKADLDRLIEARNKAWDKYIITRSEDDLKIVDELNESIKEQKDIIGDLYRAEIDYNRKLLDMKQKRNVEGLTDIMLLEEQIKFINDILASQKEMGQYGLSAMEILDYEDELIDLEKEYAEALKDRQLTFDEELEHRKNIGKYEGREIDFINDMIHELTRQLNYLKSINDYGEDYEDIQERIYALQQQQTEEIQNQIDKEKELKMEKLDENQKLYTQLVRMYSRNEREAQGLLNMYDQFRFKQETGMYQPGGFDIAEAIRLSELGVNLLESNQMRDIMSLGIRDLFSAMQIAGSTTVNNFDFGSFINNLNTQAADPDLLYQKFLSFIEIFSEERGAKI